MAGKSSRELCSIGMPLFTSSGTRCIPIEDVAFPLHRQAYFMVEIVQVIVKSMATPVARYTADHLQDLGFFLVT